MFLRDLKEMEREGEVGVAVAYRNISRAGESNNSKAGYNDKPWCYYSLIIYLGGYVFHHNRIKTGVLGPHYSR